MQIGLIAGDEKKRIYIALFQFKWINLYSHSLWRCNWGFVHDKAYNGEWIWYV